MNNYKVLFSLKVLKRVLTHFVDIFLTLYFLEVSENNILPLGIYKLVAVVAIFAVMFFTRNYCKSKHRINLIRTGIILNFIYFLTIILLKEKVVDKNQALHMIGSHMNEYSEWGALVLPKMLEVLIINFADDMDAHFEPAHIPIKNAKQGDKYKIENAPRTYYKSLNPYYNKLNS